MGSESLLLYRISHRLDKSDASYKFREIYGGDSYRFDEKSLSYS